MKRLAVLAALILLCGIVLSNSIIVTADDSDILIDGSNDPEEIPEEAPIYETIDDITTYVIEPCDYIESEAASEEFGTQDTAELVATTLEYTTPVQTVSDNELTLPEPDGWEDYDRPYIEGKPYVDTVFNRGEYNNGFEPIWEYEGMYAEVYEVISVERDNDDCDLVTIGDDRFVYQFISDGSDWITGDFCAVIMAKNGTPEVFDDTVMAAKYIG